MSENSVSVIRIVTLVCGSQLYDRIKADKEVTTCKNIPLSYPMKFVYDLAIGVYYEIIKGNEEIDKQLGDNNIVIVKNSQFGEIGVKEEDVLASIARITNFVEYNNDSSDTIDTKEEETTKE